MTPFTVLMLIFVIVLFAYLLLIERELIFKSRRKSTSFYLILFLGLGTIGMVLINPTTLDENVRGVLAGMIILSFLMDAKGFTESHISVNAMDKKGIPYGEVDRIVLLKTKNQVKVNFFRRGMRGPLFVLNEPLEEIVEFLANHLKEGTPIDILFTNYLKVRKRSSSLKKSFSPASASLEPNTNCERNCQLAGIFHSLATASSITGL